MSATDPYTYYVGLISGTSLDAVDAALVAIDDRGRPRIDATHAQPPPPDLRSDLLHLAQTVAGVSLRKLGELDQRVGHWFADAAENLLRAAGVDADRVRAIGSHGQTLRHAPDEPYPFSLQIGDPNLIAARTGIETVADFRQADLSVGGQGAPLAAALHRAVFTDADEARCVVNIGGIANLTRLPPGNAPESQVAGFDTGPGNALLDAWTDEHLGEAQDTDSQWAASGRVDDELLNLMLQDHYFRRPPPKTSGRETFNLDWVRQQVGSLMRAPPDPASVQRTLTELTARTIADAVQAGEDNNARILLCGGGAHNPLLRERLAALLAPVPVEDTDACGISVDWVEACAFAWLAMRTVHGLPGNVPSVTGASRAVVLGGVYSGKRKTENGKR